MPAGGIGLQFGTTEETLVLSRLVAFGCRLPDIVDDAREVNSFRTQEATDVLGV